MVVTCRVALRHCLQPALPKLRTRLLQTPFDVARSSLFLSLCVASRRVASHPLLYAAAVCCRSPATAWLHVASLVRPPAAFGASHAACRMPAQPNRLRLRATHRLLCALLSGIARWLGTPSA
jgi:hypothetical protein